MLRRWFVDIVPIVMALALSSCETPMVGTDISEFNKLPPPGGIVTTETSLVAGDVIQLSVEVAGVEEIASRQVVINQLGYVTLPLIGDVSIGGMTPELSRTMIAGRYSEYYVATPVVMLSLVSRGASSEWGQVTVLGWVNNPGPVSLSSGDGIRLSSAIQSAGGFSANAKKTAVRVTRQDSAGNKYQVEIDYNSIGQEGQSESDLKLFDGDIVYVPERII